MSWNPRASAGGHSSVQSSPPAASEPRGVSPSVVIVVVVMVAAVSIAATAVGVSYWNRTPSSSLAKLNVTDDAGRTVTLDHPAQRIVVLQPSAMDVLFRLGLRDRVVAVDCGSPSAGGVLQDYSPDQAAQWNLSGAGCVEAFPALDFQAIYAFHPDLVIGAAGTKVSDLETITSSTGTSTLYLNPSTLVGIANDVTIVGILTGTSTNADALNAAMSLALSHDESELSNITAVPRVLLTFYVDSTGYWTFGPGTFGEDLVTLAGATSLTGNDTAANQGEIAGSYVLAADPDVVLVGTGFGLNVSDYAVAPDWSSLAAVGSPGHLLGVDSTLLTEPDPSMVFGVSTLTALLHPELHGGAAL